MVIGYRNSVWLSENTITKIIALSNLRFHCLITCRIEEIMFVIHREYEGKPNVQFRIHESNLQYFNPRDKEFTFFHAIS